MKDELWVNLEWEHSLFSLFLMHLSFFVFALCIIAANKDYAQYKHKLENTSTISNFKANLQVFKTEIFHDHTKSTHCEWKYPQNSPDSSHQKKRWFQWKINQDDPEHGEDLIPIIINDDILFLHILMFENQDSNSIAFKFSTTIERTDGKKHK